MSFNDDEPIVVAPDVPGGEGKPAAFIAGKTKLTVINNTEAPLEETKPFKVLLELTGSGSGDDRPGVDLVTVLDVSGSMKDNGKIAKMKTAMQFVIRKLSPIDRLSVVTFSANSTRLCPLRQVNDKSQAEIEGLVNGLSAAGFTDIKAGLQTGLEVLNKRKLKAGRVAGIMLMSDGKKNPPGCRFIIMLRDLLGCDATKVQGIGDVPVYTFGFGADHDSKVLKDIADNSKGGTFSDVQNQNNLSIAFWQCLARLLTVVVEDLKLTVARVEPNSTVDKVTAGNYPQSTNNDEGSVTVSFGDLYNKEVRKVLVDLTLPEVPKRIGVDILEINYSYNTGGKLFDANPIIIAVTRDRGDKEEVVVEENCVKTAEMIKEARVMADDKKLDDAKDKLVKAENMLADVRVTDDKTTPLIDMLRSELQQLLRLMRSQDMYKKKGRPFALSSETCHARQRFATRGLKLGQNSTRIEENPKKRATSAFFLSFFSFRNLATWTNQEQEFGIVSSSVNSLVPRFSAFPHMHDARVSVTSFFPCGVCPLRARQGEGRQQHQACGPHMSPFCGQRRRAAGVQSFLPRVVVLPRVRRFLSAISFLQQQQPLACRHVSFSSQATNQRLPRVCRIFFNF